MDAGERSTLVSALKDLRSSDTWKILQEAAWRRIKTKHSQNLLHCDLWDPKGVIVAAQEQSSIMMLETIFGLDEGNSLLDDVIEELSPKGKDGK